MSGVIIDTFSGRIGGMKSKDKADTMKVLRMLSGSPRFSVFDAMESAALGRSLESLVRSGYITIDNSRGFPWSDADVTTKGLAALSATRAEGNGESGDAGG